jgi:hypothetical protein
VADIDELLGRKPEPRPQIGEMALRRAPRDAEAYGGLDIEPPVAT